MPEWKVPGYTELKALGSGGFGDVVLARHDASGTLVAIKYLRPDLLADPEFAEMFRSEATVLASLEDPNVVRLYEYVESPRGAAIVMELIGGVSLREILAYQGKTTAETALVVLQGSLLGLAAAHRRGVVHRDYKPENVLVNGDGISKLADFGIAARTGDRPIPAGTVPYAAPEQMAGAAASPASDVYAATATFYECLTGRPPFSGETADLLRQHRTEPVSLDPIPGPLRPLVAAGMAKDPAGRPTDATSFVTELNTAASGAYGRRWADRGRSHLGEAALLLAALWPSGAPPTVQDTTVHRIPLHQRIRPRRIGPAGAAVAASAVIAVVAAGVVVAATVPHRPSPPSQPVAVVQPVSLQPSPTLHSPSTGSGTSSAPTAGSGTSSAPTTGSGTSSAPTTGSGTSSAPTTGSGTTSPPNTGTTLSDAFNNVGISDDADPAAGNTDGGGFSYSAQALAAAGLTPGASVTVDGMTFTWPDVADGAPDNVLASGQTIAVSGSGSLLGFLGAGDYYSSSGTGTITYTDGTTQGFTLSLADWWANAAGPGGDIVATLPYMNTSTGQMQRQVSVYVATVPLQAGKTMQSVTLPDVSQQPVEGSPAMHIFAVAISS